MLKLFIFNKFNVRIEYMILVNKKRLFMKEKIDEYLKKISSVSLDDINYDYIYAVNLIIKL